MNSNARTKRSAKLLTLGQSRSAAILEAWCISANIAVARAPHDPSNATIQPFQFTETEDIVTLRSNIHDMERLGDWIEQTTSAAQEDVRRLKRINSDAKELTRQLKRFYTLWQQARRYGDALEDQSERHLPVEE